MTHIEVIQTLLADILASRGFNHPKIEINAVNSGGANYTSALYTVTVTENEELKLFAKVAAVGEKLRQLMRATILYQTEQLVYTKLVNVFKDLEEKNNISNDRYIFPEFFGCNPKVGEETVVLEDLIAQGYHVYSRFDSVDWEHASSAVKALAKFHALSFAYQKDDPAEFSVMAEKLKFIQDEDNEDKRDLWMKIFEKTIGVVKDESNKEKMIRFLTKLDGRDELYKLRMPLKAVVLSHGDYRTSNLLFKQDNDGILQTMVVDYQTMHTGSPVADLLYFIVTGTDEEFRREHYQQLLDFYNEELGAALHRLKLDVNEVYPREVFEQELKELLPCALRFAVITLPMVTVSTEDAPHVEGDADHNQFAVAPNELYTQRMNGLVDDFARWGVI